jgi:hypothetical protein
MRDVTVVLKYETPAISDFLTGNHTCILKYLYFLSRVKFNNGFVLRLLQ